MASDRKHTLSGVAVLGLGRFGRGLAVELEEAGTEVLGVDLEPDVIQPLSGLLTHVVAADTTNEEALRQLSVHEFEHVVIAIGSDVEASILTTSLVVSFGVPNVWAKAISDAHGRILQQLGADRVVYPEADMGRRIAHLVRGRLLDYVEFEDDFALVKTAPPAEMIGRPMGDAWIRQRYDLAVVAVQSGGGPFTYATPETVLQTGDVIIVAGRTDRIESFSELPQLTSPAT